MYEIRSMNADSFYGFFNNSNHADKGTLWQIVVWPVEEVLVKGRIPKTYDAELDVVEVRSVSLDRNPAQVRIESNMYLEDGTAAGSSTAWFRKEETIYYVISDKAVPETDFQIANDGITPINKGEHHFAEAECGTCGETFLPADKDDLIHLTRNDGNDCGGQGKFVGVWTQAKQ